MYFNRGRSLNLILLYVTGLMGVIFAPPLSMAATPNSPSEILTAPLEIEVTPDLWAFSTKTQAVVDGERITTHLPFDESARNLRSIFLGEAALSKGPLIVLADVNYASVSLSGHDVPSALNRIDIDSLWSTLGVGYAFRGELSPGAHRFQWLLQPTAVALYTSQDVSVRGNGGETLRSLDANWWTPALGLRASLTSGHWGVRFVGYTDIADDSRSARQVALGLEYTLHSTGFGTPTFGLGYRYRYDQRVYSADSQLSTTLRGPMAYVNLRL